LLNGDEDESEIAKSSKIADLIESNQEIEQHLFEVIRKLDSTYVPKV
jgi:hypothetical protein